MNPVSLQYVAILPSAYSRNPMHFLLGGDAEVLIWERLWNRYKSNPEVLEYDLLLTPHLIVRGIHFPIIAGHNVEKMLWRC